MKKGHAIGVLLGALAGLAIFLTTFAANPSSNSGTYNSCAYSGYSQWYAPSVWPPKSYSQTYSACGDGLYLSVYVYDALGYEHVYSSGWVGGDLVPYSQDSWSTVNVYGYHQIRKPTDSPTLETHAY